MGKFYLYSLGSFVDFTTFVNLSAIIITDSRVLVSIVGTSSERVSAMLSVLRQRRKRNWIKIDRFPLF